MILLFTGNGKGKTTAAIGQAIRALGQGKKVLIIQFIKGPWISGEHKFFDSIKKQWGKNFKLIRAGKGFVKILGDKLPFEEHKKAAEAGFKILQAFKNNPYDLIILDEINVAVGLKLVSEKKVLKILENFPKDKDIILTGRSAPKSFIKIADIATEMKELKHPFQKNKKSMKKGIEY